MITLLNAAEDVSRSSLRIKLFGVCEVSQANLDPKTSLSRDFGAVSMQSSFP
jgi:hypothetical protein